MRLVRPVQAVVGLAAASGLVLVLSGNAWAADSSIDTIAQQPAVAEGKQAVTKVVEEVTPQAKPDVKANDSKTTTVEGGGSDDVKAAADELAAADQKVVSPKVTSGSTVPASQVKTSSVATVGVIASDKAKPVITLSMVDDRISDGPGAVSPAQLVDQSATPITAPVDGSKELQTAVAVHWTTTVLPIQPIITNHAVADLAAFIPSAPMPAKAPAPAQSAGLLSNLADQLANTALPQLLMPHDIMAEGLAMTLNLGIMLILFLNVFTFTYGQWLRRGGFATAARSDAPAAITSPFATPSLLGYAAQPLRLHNPLFDGGRNEILKQTDLVPNAYRKEEKL